MHNTDISFDSFFSGKAEMLLTASIRLALDEDGQDLTSDALFPEGARAVGEIVAKEHTLCAGLPVVARVLDAVEHGAGAGVMFQARDGDELAPGDVACTISASARTLLRAERVALNFLSHMSGIANLTRQYVDAMGGTKTRLLDTRKTLPGLRFHEKYGVLIGGGKNHRMNLEELLMLKDNHIDRAGSIAGAVRSLRATYTPCPPIEVECRNEAEVREAVATKVERIMLDNMGVDELAQMLSLIPEGIESEVSGGVNMQTIAAIAKAGPDFVSVGRLTHSAPAADFSLRISTT